MSNQTFIKYIGDCFINKIGVAAFQNLHGSITLKAVSVPSDSPLSNAYGYIERTISLPDFENDWVYIEGNAALHKAFTFIGYYPLTDDTKYS